MKPPRTGTTKLWAKIVAAKHPGLFPKRMLAARTELEALLELEKAATRLVEKAVCHGYQTPITELRRPLMELKLARHRAKVFDKQRS